MSGESACVLPRLRGVVIYVSRDHSRTVSNHIHSCFLSLAASLVDAPTDWFVGVEHDEMVPGADVLAGLGPLVSIDNAANPSRDSAPR